MVYNEGDCFTTPALHYSAGRPPSPELDGAKNSTTLPNPMNNRIRAAAFAVVLALLLPGIIDGAVVFKPGKNTKFVAPGEEKMSTKAARLFQAGQEAEKRGDLKGAVKYYKVIIRKYPQDVLAPGACFHTGELLEKLHDYLTAADAYRLVVARYHASPHFDPAIEAQFRIGEMLLQGDKHRLFGFTIGSPVDRATEVFASIIRTAPYGKYTARAQFDIGLAREKGKANDAALIAYQAVIDKFPNDPVAANAQYQIGYLWLTAAKAGTKDIDAAQKARTAFEDFLFRFPNSEKAAQARANLALLVRKQTNSVFDIARFYDKQKHYRAAVIYYNEVIRQQPGSSESERAKKRIDQIKAKIGEKALLPVGEQLAAADKNKSAGKPAAGGASGAPPVANSSSPLPPAESDPSLPPPASLLPDSTLAPSPGSSPDGSSAGLAPAPASSPSPSPETTASPGP